MSLTADDQKKYIPEGHTPFAKPMAELYSDAHEELALPFPSVPLKNFPKLTLMTGGLRPFEFTILCGATGTGKTTLCANISRDLDEQGVAHFVASVETGHTDFIKRTMSALAGEDWNTGDAVPLEKLKKFHSEHGSLFHNSKAWLSLYDNRVKIESLMADIAWMVDHNDCKIAIIDNLNFFLEVTKSSEQIIEMDRVIHDLIMFCKRIPIHIIMVMHPKKTDHGRVESEFDIKGSSTAVQEAHNILLFNRIHEKLVESGVARPNDREIMIAKMRRKGKFVRRRLVIKALDGVRYYEGEVV